MKNQEHLENHESYGTVVVTHPSGGARPLFACSVLHTDTVTLQVHRAYHKRDLHTDWIAPDGRIPIVEIEMSHAQFSEMVASHSKGCGTPCTIRYVVGNRMADPPYNNPQLVYRKEFKKRMEKIASQLNELVAQATEFQNKPTVTKKDRTELLGAINSVKSRIISDLPFAAEMFEETMEKSVHEAKKNIDAHILAMIHETGLSSLRQAAPVLEIESNM